MLYKDILLVGLGGGVGSIARFLCQRSVSAWYPHAFPFGTLIVNFLGCFLIGLLLGLALPAAGATTVGVPPVVRLPLVGSIAAVRVAIGLVALAGGGYYLRQSPGSRPAMRAGRMPWGAGCSSRSACC